MIKIDTKEGISLVSEVGVLGVQRNNYYPDKEGGYYSLEIQYAMGMVMLKFNTKPEADEALEYIENNVSGVVSIGSGKEEYIKGFKEGVEYSLRIFERKLNDNK